MMFGILAAGAILLFMGQSSQKQNIRKVLVKVPFPNGPVAPIPKNELYKYGYVIQGTMVYHITELNQQGTSGLNAQTIQNWAQAAQTIINQGLDAYTAINQALEPSLTIVANFDANTFSYTAKDGLNFKSGTMERGQTLSVKINNSKSVEFQNFNNGFKTVTSIAKMDGTVVATKTIFWMDKKVV